VGPAERKARLEDCLLYTSDAADDMQCVDLGGRTVPHYMHNPGATYARFFQSRFVLRRAYGIGILRPPHTVQRIPSVIVDGLDRMERPLRGLWPFRDWGRFFVLELERR